MSQRLGNSITTRYSAYRWIRDKLVRMGVPPCEIAFMQDFKKSEAKQRLFRDVRAGKVRFLIGSSDTMGTGVNAQLRAEALHHLDVPWLLSQIEQRESRILRQGNQHDVVDILPNATEGRWTRRCGRTMNARPGSSLQHRRATPRCDGSRTSEGQANQFAMAKAVASGNPRLIQEAGLEAAIALLERLRCAHQDDEFAIRRQIRDTERDIEYRLLASPRSEDLARRVPTAGGAFRMRGGEETFTERKLAGRALMKEVLTVVQLQHADDSVIARIGRFELEYS